MKRIGDLAIHTKESFKLIEMRQHFKLTYMKRTKYATAGIAWMIPIDLQAMECYNKGLASLQNGPRLIKPAKKRWKSGKHCGKMDVQV